MRVTILFLIAGIGISNATATYSQSTHLSITLNNKTVKEVFDAIENNSEYIFFYYDNVLDINRKVSLSVKNQTVDKILDKLFESTNNAYVIEDRQIFISKKTVIPESAIVQQQSRIITGTITDNAQEPLIGVNILIKGTTVGTITDIDGKFSLSTNQPNPVLVASYIGFKSQEVRVGNQQNLQIVLQADELGLEEVVVVGYGTVRKKDLTGSVASVTLADVDKQPVIRVEDALKGKATGVQILKQNSAPGASMKIRIRGANSVNGKNEPLYVIDGFVGGDFSSLNPNDIETINILKDASSTAVYGSRGSNGVVLVTTKQAKEQDTKIEYDGFLSWEKAAKKMDLLSATQYMEVANARQDALGLDHFFTQNQIDDIRQNGGVNYQDEVMRTGLTQNHQVAISGGSPKIKYYMSGSYVDQEGIIENSYYKRYGIRSNLSSTIAKKVDVTFNIYGTFTDARNNNIQSGRSGITGSALIFPMNIPVMDATTGDYSASPAGYGPIASNPVFQAKEGLFDKNGIRALSNVQLTWRIIDGLKLSIAGGIDIGANNNRTFKRYQPLGSVSSSEADHANSMFYTYQNTNTLSYEKTFADIHRFDASVVYEQQKSISRSSWAYSSGFPTIALKYNGLQLGSAPRVNSGYSEWALQSYLGRINYTLAEKYLFTFAMRADGSSKFADGNKYGYYPSGAIAWRTSEESFIKNLNLFQSLKLRASYGVVGSQAIDPYKTLAAMALERDYYFNMQKSIGIGTGGAPNPDLKWESTAQTNIGLDFGIFNGRLSGTIDYYYKKTTDLHFDVSVPIYNGSGSITQNIGSMRNKGWEFMVTGVIFDRKDFQLTTSANLSINRNKILDMGEEEELFVTDSDTGSDGYLVLQKGKPLGQFRGLVYEGVWKSHEAEAAKRYNNVPGDSKYKDLNDDGVIDGSDMEVIGNALPKFTWGWNTNVTYKNFDLSIFFNGSQGNDVWNLTRFWLVSGHIDVKVPTSKEILNRWTPQNENTDIAGFSATNNNRKQSSQYVENGSFARLSNITLGYTFDKLKQNTFIKQAKLYVSAQNLFVITKYKGFDPESSITKDSMDTMQGLDDACYPSTRSFTVGVKFGF
ncbi:MULTISPECIES: TonB-dependent receptor [unclassified Parabacteroides]|uniref:TonB-dependent receptor n=1 Tax=unclassified Parabacteroides TaxID=2649774 RepID=UPI0024745478|nr:MULTISPECIES: TonB-dependent receptor [unclassified Parabacteroides]